MKKIIEYCEFHIDHPPFSIEELSEDNLDDIICDFDSNLLKNTEDLYKILNAAHFLKIKNLTDLICLKMALMVDITSPRKMKEILDFVSI